MKGKKAGNEQIKMKESNSKPFKQTEELKEKNVLVVDSAASWMVCAGAFCIFLLFSAFGRAITICFLDFVEVFDVSITMTSLSFTFQLMAISVSALLVSNVVVPLTGERVAAFVGCFVNGVCTIGVAYSPNITVFHIFMGTKGLCTGMAFITSTSILSQYFEKRRSLATALSFCGLGVGSMFTPPLVEFLREEYGLNGVFLIMAGLEFHAVAAALLLRPLSCYSRVITQAELQLTAKADDVENGTAEMDALLTDNADARELTEDKLRHEFINGFRPCTDGGDGSHANYKQIDNNEEESMVHGNLNDKNANGRNGMEGFTSNNKNAIALDLNNFTGTHTYQNNRRRTLSLKDDERNVYQDTTEPILQVDVSRRLLQTQLSADFSLNGKSNRYSHHATNLSPAKSLQGTSCAVGESGQSRKSPLLHIHRDMSHPANGGHSNGGATHTSSTWSIASAPLCEMALDTEVLALENAERRAAGQAKGSPNLHNKTVNGGRDKALESGQHNVSRQVSKAESRGSKRTISCWGQTRDAFRGMFSKELLRTWSMRFLLMSCASGSAANYLVAYLPALAAKSGLSPSDIALLMTINGAVDLVSRICIGFFSDLHILTPGQITAITQICLGTVMHFTRFYTDYYTILFLCVMAGMFAGIRQNMSSLITIEFMGMARFRRALGFAAMVSTLSLAVYHPLLSSILEATESFAPPLNCAGLFCYIGAAFNLMAPLAKRLDAARSKTEEKKQAENSRPS